MNGGYIDERRRVKKIAVCKCNISAHCGNFCRRTTLRSVGGRAPPNLNRFYSGFVFFIGCWRRSKRVSFHRVVRKDKQIVIPARERANGSSLHDNHSQRHIAECGGIVGPVL
jgi:hypothetical protein